VWNAFGPLDLFSAITLGALSAQGTPLRVFAEGPGTLAMTTLPWLVAPTMLVPLYLLIHLVIATRLHALKQKDNKIRAHSPVQLTYSGR
jgi:hypothetical protein